MKIEVTTLFHGEVGKETFEDVTAKIDDESGRLILVNESGPNDVAVFAADAWKWWKKLD